MDRKKDHIDLTSSVQMKNNDLDQRFYYEPLLNNHPKKSDDLSLDFLGYKMKFPLWVSSMTGGTREAKKINENLARAVNEFGLGMGLGSCRTLLESEDNFQDFNLRAVIGDDRPFYANLGIAQVEECLLQKNLYKIENLVEKLDASGLIVHVNPLQEWIQMEGNRFQIPPLETIQMLVEKFPYKIIVKEVGQGMGPESLHALLSMKIAAIEFGAFGGTNFSYLEGLRQNNNEHNPLYYVGHSADEMLGFIADYKGKIECQGLVISGGVKTFLDGHYLINRLGYPCVYGQAQALLKHARGAYTDLRGYVASQVRGLLIANKYLRVRKVNPFQGEA